MATLSSSRLSSSPLCKSKFSPTVLVSEIDFIFFSSRTTLSSSTISVVSPAILSLSIKHNRQRNSLQVKSVAGPTETASEFDEMVSGTKRKYYMLEGKRGVGKTSCAASLAVRFANSWGNLNLENCSTHRLLDWMKPLPFLRSFNFWNHPSITCSPELCLILRQRWQAMDYARLNHSTISFFDYSRPETAVSRWNRVSLNASKVGKGLSIVDKAQKLAFQHWIEAIDPRHRYGHNLHLYYEEWCKADAGQPFFYWLDVGEGKDLDLNGCPRSKLKEQCIRYLGPQEREEYEYVIIEGKIVHKLSGKFLHTMHGSEGTKWIFVMSTYKKLYAGLKKKGRFHHSSFLAGGATLAAGRVVVDNGVLKTISAYSGHYRPSDDSLDTFLSFLRENAVSLDDVEVHKASEDSDNYDDYFKSNGDGSKSLKKEDATSKAEAESDENGNGTFEETKRSSYQRTLSGGLESPKADVPQKAMLQRINSKKQSKSLQLGHQLMLKWSTGAGPRIGCAADYPVQLRTQALEFVNLSPRHRSSTLSPTGRIDV